MPKHSGGQGKGKPKLGDKSFGKALFKSHARTMDDGLVNRDRFMNSILHNSHLDEFVSAAEMEKKTHEVIRAPDAELRVVNPSTIASIQKMRTNEFAFKHLRIPRKPAWTRQMTADDIDMREKASFMEWRREIATLEEQSTHLKVTPFEKNLEVWRQLWRVMERCGIAFQIVDARNPLLYYTNDLISYGLEHNPPRPVLLLINKADYLTEYQRKLWAIELESMGIKFAFYSAMNEQHRIDENANSEFALMEKRLRKLELSSGPIQPVFDEPVSMPSSSTIPIAVAPALRAKVDERKRVDMSVLFAGVDSDSDEENETAGESTEVKVKSVPAVTADEEEDESEEEEVVEEEEEEDYLEEYLKWCDDEAIDLLADDLVYQFEQNVTIRATLAKKINKKAASKKSSKPATVYVWGNGSETVLNTGAAEDKPDAATAAKAAPSSTSAEYDDVIRRRCRVLTREELILLMTILPEKMNVPSNIKDQGRCCIGLIGYPNVGKSSVINTILGVSKTTHTGLRVAVSSTPGKTKHFQTLNINNELMLCDCPGLVFPSFMRSTGEMLSSGVLPINQMRDYVDPADVIASRVPMHLLNAAYGMTIKRNLDIKDDPNRPPTGHEMLCAYCEVKTYITNGTGNWDEFRACKELLRDFNDGKLLFVASPPSIKQFKESVVLSRDDQLQVPGSRTGVGAANLAAESHQEYSDELKRWLQETEASMLRKERVAERVAAQKLKEIDQHAKEEEEGSDESDDDDDDKREHKSRRRRCWGKKSRKLRSENPYDTSLNGTVNYVAYTTNRAKIGGEKQAKVSRHSASKSYGTEFSRALYPHHLSVQKAKTTEEE